MSAFQPTKNELIRGMSEDEYFASHAVSSSTLKDFDRSAAYASYRMVNRSEPTPAMEFGTAAHVKVLEPAAFDSRYAMDPQHEKGGYPRGWRNSTAYKDTKEAITSQGKNVLTAEQMLTLEVMRQNVYAHPIGRILEKVKKGTEVSGFAHDEEFDTWLRIRPDMLAPDARMVIDLKKTVDVTPSGFARQCARYRYADSAAQYLDVMELIVPGAYEHYVFLCVSESAPYEVAAYVLDFDSLSQGRANYRRHLAQYAECMARDEWPGPNTKIEEIRLPAYALNMEDIY